MQRILNDPKPHRVHYANWERFKLMSTILFFTGLRVGELRDFNREKLLDLIDKSQVELFQTKTNANRLVLMPKYGRRTLKTLRVSIDTVCPNDDTLLYPFKDNKKNKIVEFINDFLKPYCQEFNIKLTSHSFRAGFITNLLHKTPLHQVQQLAAHKDVRSTMCYNRHNIIADEGKNLLDSTFDSFQDDDKIA